MPEVIFFEAVTFTAIVEAVTAVTETVTAKLFKATFRVFVNIGWK